RGDDDQIAVWNSQRHVPAEAKATDPPESTGAQGEFLSGLFFPTGHLGVLTIRIARTLSASLPYGTRASFIPPTPTQSGRRRWWPARRSSRLACPGLRAGAGTR